MSRLHNLSSSIVLVFLTMHLVSFLAAIAGAVPQAQIFNAMRMIYRHPVIEVVVLLAFVVHFITGSALCREAWGPKSSIISKINAVAMIYLGGFILIHGGMIAYGRLVLHQDTDIGFVGNALTDAPLSYGLYGLYVLAILAVFTHIGTHLLRLSLSKAQILGYGTLIFALGGGIFISYLMVLILGGHYMAMPKAVVHDPDAEAGFTPEHHSY